MLLMFCPELRGAQAPRSEEKPARVSSEILRRILASRRHALAGKHRSGSVAKFCAYVFTWGPWTVTDFTALRAPEGLEPSGAQSTSAADPGLFARIGALLDDVNAKHSEEQCEQIH